MLPLKFLILSFCVIPQALPWPDGAPCIHAAFESMNPLEAVEHQGGLQVRHYYKSSNVSFCLL